VIKAEGVVKDSAYLTQIHATVVDEASEGKPERCLGGIMDGTSANRNSMKELENLMALSVWFVCQAHRSVGGDARPKRGRMAMLVLDVSADGAAASVCCCFCLLMLLPRHPPPLCCALAVQLVPHPQEAGNRKTRQDCGQRVRGRQPDHQLHP
jgi:hypothetical protein